MFEKYLRAVIVLGLAQPYVSIKKLLQLIGGSSTC